MQEGSPSRSVLVVDDDDALAVMLEPHLIAEGFTPHRARTGRDVVGLLREGRLRMVLVDLGLPDRTGIEVARSIRSTSDIPMIVFTPPDSERDTLAGFEAGADDCISTSCTAREVLARIHAVLRRSTCAHADAERLTVGHVTIDAARREIITAGGGAVRPTAREFDLVWYLARNRGLTLTRSQILAAVWDEEYFGDTRTIDAHVGQLRRKVPDLPLATVWGVGYRIEP